MTDVYIDRNGEKKPQWIKSGGFWSWSRKRKIIVVLIAIIAILLIVQFVFNKPVAQEGPYTLIVGFTQELYAEGDGNPDVPDSNYVVFPYSIFFCLSNHNPETVFASVLEDSGQLIIFSSHPDDSSQWVSWTSTRFNQGLPNTLEQINPYITYYVHTDVDYTLQISCWD